MNPASRRRAQIAAASLSEMPATRASSRVVADWPMTEAVCSIVLLHAPAAGRCVLSEQAAHGLRQPVRLGRLHQAEA